MMQKKYFEQKKHDRCAHILLHFLSTMKEKNINILQNYPNG
jgi:hypothetical protein